MSSKQAAFFSVLCALERVEDAVRASDSEKLLLALHSPALALKVMTGFVLIHSYDEF